MTSYTTPAALRAATARGEWRQPTAGLLDGYQQANLVVLPQSDAYEFLLFCVRNAKACPVLAVSEAGQTEILMGKSHIDLRTMFPRYRVWQQGQLADEPYDLLDCWPDDAVAFLLGCSHSLDGALRRAGIPVSLAAPPVYLTQISCQPTARMQGYVAVSMRPVAADKVDEAVALSAAYPSAHGTPLHIGDPTEIGITDLAAPDFGVFPGVHPGQVPVFWACGVTPQQVLPALGSAYLFTHYAGHMLVLDDTVEHYSAQLR
ncbi:D-glutamate cyclase family protein [Pantoea cypripedii]|uniref:Hydro-lyase n=1 Tax=Pantoea cypripedii TaxID=55209 RepID=A0A1X1EL78_PANCY|nr:DUF1445 domain-containing protein [Pantoea cypripedii]MBP2199963.1 uncharacterized protein YcsI (UPF0317 family) [Pantoea cypripedii]ORM89582.1 hypothetical protein HA50_23495 [Pantoea cypripedii]